MKTTPATFVNADEAEYILVPMYYHVDKDGDRVYDTDLMFQHFEELIEELHNAESRPE